MNSSSRSSNVTLKPIEVPKALQEGEKFIKWDEVCFPSSFVVIVVNDQTSFVLMYLLLIINIPKYEIYINNNKILY